MLSVVRGGHDFEQMLNQLGVDSVDIVLAISESSADAFRRGLVPLASRCTASAEDWPAKIAQYAEKLDYLFEVVRAMGPWATGENVREFREGLHLGVRSRPLGQGHESAQLVVSRKPRGRLHARVSQPAPVDKQGVPSLKQAETKAKEPWVRRLAAIVDRAGDAATFVAELAPVAEMTVLNATELQHAMLGRGAWATIRGHVLAWERFEKWVAGRVDVYPPGLAALVAFAADRSLTCGPAVLPAFRATVSWLGRRIGLKTPDLAVPAFMAIEDRVYERAGKELKEAVPLDVRFITSLEHCVTQWAQDGRLCRAIRAWQALCMTWGSMRFDDALHVRPDTVHDCGAALRCVAWQTKTERKGRGTRFAVCKASFSSGDWVAAGLAAYRQTIPKIAEKSDFWLVEGSVDALDFQTPLSRTGFADILVELANHVCELNPLELDQDGLAEMLLATGKASAHSPRVTMVSMMVHAGADTLTLQMQGNWKDVKMPEKYIRDRKSIPMAFITKMVHNMKYGNKDEKVMALRDVDEDKVDHVPASGSDVVAEPPAKAMRVEVPEMVATVDDEAAPEEDAMSEADLSELCFWVSARAEIMPNSDCKFHVISLTEPGKLACNSMPLHRCIPLGFEWPERGSLCAKCIEKRPDAVLAGPDHID